MIKPLIVIYYICLRAFLCRGPVHEFEGARNRGGLFIVLHFAMCHFYRPSLVRANPTELKIWHKTSLRVPFLYNHGTPRKSIFQNDFIATLFFSHEFPQQRHTPHLYATTMGIKCFLLYMVVNIGSNLLGKQIKGKQFVVKQWYIIEQSIRMKIIRVFTRKMFFGNKPLPNKPIFRVLL